MTHALMLLVIGGAIGQCPPGNPCPPPAGVHKQWLVARSPIDGQPIHILGWIEAGQVRFDPREYPQFVPQPKPVQVTPNGTVGATPPTGVVASKFPTIQAGESWNGGNVVGAEGRAKDKHGKSPDVYLTIMGPEREREKVRTKLARDPEFKALARDMGDRLAVEAYDKKNPLVEDVGLPADGHPDIVVLDASGKEHSRFREDPGPSILAEAVRKADPGYRPGGGGGGMPQGPATIVWLAVGFVSGYFIFRAMRRANAP